MSKRATASHYDLANPNICYIKWWHWLFLWLIPTHTSIDDLDPKYKATVKVKFWHGKIYVVDSKIEELK